MELANVGIHLSSNVLVVFRNAWVGLQFQLILACYIKPLNSVFTPVKWGWYHLGVIVWIIN